MSREMELNYLAQELRNKLKLSPHDPIDIISVVSQIPRLTLIFAPMGNNISGICYRDVNLIAVNSEFSYGRVRFTLAHELYHLYYDRDSTKSVLLFQNLETTDIENEANLFASYLLAPYESFRRETKQLKKDNISIMDLYRLEQYFGLSRSALLFRLKKEKLIGNDWTNYKSNVIHEARILGFDDRLYLPFRDTPVVYGEYLKVVDKLYKKELISQGKRNELLTAAYRADIVLGDIDENWRLID